MRVTIDEDSGFCFGVTSAINTAENELARHDEALYCLGDIVHNSEEVNRLHSLGLVTIGHENLRELKGARVLLRAHGEPPSTYQMARENGIEIIDATCPVVLKLQQRVREVYENYGADTDIVIYGKKGHAEVMGLVGQTEGHAIVIEDVKALDAIELNRNVALFSQTTMPLDGFKAMRDAIGKLVKAGFTLKAVDTICRRVSNRAQGLKQFATSHELILFVAGAKSSNGKILFHECKSVNDKTYLISNENDINPSWLDGVATIGICGATSTPRWLMEQVKQHIEKTVDAAGAETN